MSSVYSILNNVPSFLELFVYTRPDIPPKKVRNAISAYSGSSSIYEDDVILLADDTLFGSAKEGMIVTMEEFMFKTSNSYGAGYGFVEDVVDIEAIGNTLAISTAKNYYSITFTVSEKRMEAFASYLKKLFDAIKES